MQDIVNWPGNAGNIYSFELYGIGQNFNPVSGIYIFCRLVAPGKWEALYVGETESFHDRLDAGLQDHDGFKRAQIHGATHVAVMLSEGLFNRLQIETELIHSLQPKCNKQGLASVLSGR